MANITIYEQDLTTGSVTDSVSNVAYVPGYAIMGPVGTPTLCRTLDEFKMLFGTKPYTFKNNQDYPSNFTKFKPVGSFARKGDYEKSYMYAVELLRSGLSVLFERIMPNAFSYIGKSDSTKISFADGTGSFEIESKYPGVYGKNISFDLYTTSYNVITENLTTSTGSAESIPTGKYTFTVGGTTYYVIPDASSFIVSDAEEGGATLENIDGDEIAVSVVEGNPVVTIDGDTVELTPLVKDGSVLRTIKVLAGSIIEDGSVIRYENGSPVYIDVVQNKVYVGDNIKVLEDVEFTGEGAVILAGSQLAYGSTIDGELIIDSKLTAVYNLKVNIDTNAYGIPQLNEEIIPFSFNPNSADYIGNKDFGKIVNVKYTLPQSNTPTLVISNNNKSASASYGYASTLNLLNDDREDEFKVQDIYTYLGIVDNTGMNRLLDKNEYDIKFITSGSYPVYGYLNNSVMLNMMKVAGDRGDCIALIDHADVAVTKELYQEVNLDVYENTSTGENLGKYGAMFSPWGLYNVRSLGTTSTMPGSFAYLKCLANSLKLNDNWYAIAGVTRGLVGDLLQLTYPISGAMSDLLQNGASGDKVGRAINPIVNIKPYGNCIWGNRTLFKNDSGLVASSFLNIRMLSDSVKKAVYTAAKKMTFELNTDILWLNFKSEIIPTLDSMVAGNGLSNYKISRKATNKKATVACVIRLYAVEAVEDWDITIELSDSYISVE